MKTLKEKWFMYQQIECKDGFVDIYIGDTANNPNYDKPSKWQLNSIRV